MHDPLPRVDLVFCRDCLVHLPFADALKALEKIQSSGSRYLLTTTFPGRRNSDIATGEWHVIDLQAKPFLFPSPLLVFKEGCIDPPGYSDKTWGFGELQTCPISVLSELRWVMRDHLSGAILRKPELVTKERKNSIQRGRTASEE